MLLLHDVQGSEAGNPQHFLFNKKMSNVPYFINYDVVIVITMINKAL